MKQSGEGFMWPWDLYIFLNGTRHKGLFHKNQNKICYIQAEVNTIKKFKKFKQQRYFGVNYTEICLDSQAKHKEMFFKIYLCVYPKDSYLSFIKVWHSTRQFLNWIQIHIIVKHQTLPNATHYKAPFQCVHFHFLSFYAINIG